MKNFFLGLILWFSTGLASIAYTLYAMEHYTIQNIFLFHIFLMIMLFSSVIAGMLFAAPVKKGKRK